MDQAAAKDGAGQKTFQIEEGFAIALEVIERLKAAPGVKGINLLPEGKEALVPRAIQAAKLPAPAIRHVG